MTASDLTDHGDSGGTFHLQAPEDLQQARLDLFLVSRLDGFSRSRLQALIKGGHARVNDQVAKASHRLKPGDRVTLCVPPAAPPELAPEDVPFEVVYEDTSLLVIDKPAGVVVHPAPGHDRGTLVHGLLRHCQNLSGIGGMERPGIVHRLDKDTSGLMVVAKTDHAHASLSRQFQTGEVRKQYLALVHGLVKNAEGKVDRPIGRHPHRRQQMAVRASGGRAALTLWRRLEVLGGPFTLLKVTIKSGRTHQIRVHLAHIGHPVVGDPVYGPGRNWWRRHPVFQDNRFRVTHQMLHAVRLGFRHPETDAAMAFEAPVPDEMDQLLRCLRKDAQSGFGRTETY